MNDNYVQHELLKLLADHERHTRYDRKLRMIVFVFMILVVPLQFVMFGAYLFRGGNFPLINYFTGPFNLFMLIYHAKYLWRGPFATGVITVADPYYNMSMERTHLNELAGRWTVSEYKVNTNTGEMIAYLFTFSNKMSAAKFKMFYGM